MDHPAGGERSGQRYSIGTRLQVQVGRVDLDARRIDFRLVQDERTAASLPQRGPGRSRAARRAAALLQQQDDEDGFVPSAGSVASSRAVQVAVTGPARGAQAARSGKATKGGKSAKTPKASAKPSGKTGKKTR